MYNVQVLSTLYLYTNYRETYTMSVHTSDVSLVGGCVYLYSIHCCTVLVVDDVIVVSLQSSSFRFVLL